MKIAAPGGKLCSHPNHKPPMHLYIPPGKTHVHTCPACGNKIELKGNDIRYEKNREDEDFVQNRALGDMLNTGIPGGIDMDFTTPW